MEKLSRKQYQFLLGSLLGDAGIAKHGRLHRARFAQSIKQREYLDWKLKIMKKFVRMPIYTWTMTNKEKEYMACSFSTLSKSVFKRPYLLFYKNGVKRITHKLLNLITPFSLAVWYMDDGCLVTEHDNRHGKCIKRYRAYIALGKITDYEVQLVKGYFEKLGIPSHIMTGHNKEYNRNYPVIKFTYPGTRRFMKIIERFVPRCMRYKIHLSP